MESTGNKFHDKFTANNKAVDAISPFLDPIAKMKQSISTVQHVPMVDKNILAIESKLEKANLTPDTWGKTSTANNGKLAFWKRKKEVELLDTKISKINESLNRVQEFIELREDDCSDSKIEPIFLDDEDWVKLAEIIDVIQIDNSREKVDPGHELFVGSLEEILSGVDWRTLLSNVVVYLDDRRDTFIKIKDKIEKSYALSLKLDIRREIRKFLKLLFRNNSDEEDILTSKTINEFFRIKIFLNNENKTIYPIYRYSFS